MPDHEPSKEQKLQEYVREQVGQMQQQRIAIDNMFQQVATIARLMKIKPEKFVNATQDVKANYTFLMDCIKEEQRLQAEAQDKAKEATKDFAINKDTNAKKESGGQPASA